MTKVNKETFDSVIDYTPIIIENTPEETIFYRKADLSFLGMISRIELNGRKEKSYFLNEKLKEF